MLPFPCNGKGGIYMEKRFVNDRCAATFYETLNCFPLYCKMFLDPDFFDVSTENVKAFIAFLTRENAPTRSILLMREKYRAFLLNETSGLQGVINRYGLRIPEHNVRYKTGAKTVYINEYTEFEWKVLTTETIINPNASVITAFKNRCKTKGDTHALEILNTKYGKVLEEQERNRAYSILLKHNLPPDTKFSTLDNYHIDGVTFNCWRLLNDDEYDPSKAILVSNYRFLKQFCRADDVAYIEDKYHEALFPNRKEIISEAEIVEANAFFAHIHDWPHGGDK